MWQQIKEFDVFYISYDEPNKEEFWLDLKSKFPKAKRVDGIKGFDSAHKECANNSETDWLVTVDGDNIVNPEFYKLDVEPYSDAVISWSSKNHVNGLIYGNGSLKLWPKHLILEMNTHENATEEKSQIDFCWDIPYVQKNDVYSTTHIEGSPFQAFRAGFREGVKMSLEQGLKVDPKKLEEELYDKNYHRLLIWCNIGRDVENGIWSIYGTRMGIYQTYLTDWDFTNVIDYDWFDQFWREDIFPQFMGANFNKSKIEKEVERIGNILRNEFGMPISEIDDHGSKFFKQVYVNPPRVDE